MSLYEESNQFRAELEQQVKNVDIREITQLPNFKNWFNSKKAHSKCYDYDLPKLFYRTLNSIDNLDNIVNGNEQSRFVGEYFTDDLDTALTYVEHLENSKILIGFLNIQNPAIIDCNGAGWNEIRQNATVTEQLAYFEYLGFNEKPDNFEENKAYPIDLRNDEKDDGISFFLQIKTINKDTTPSFIKITAPQYYQNDKSFRKTKFINLDMLGYGTPSLFNDIGTTNFWATNLAHRHRFDSVIFENLNDDGGRGATLFEKSVKKRKMQGTVVCAFDRENSYFKHANNHGDFNPDDRRIFYSLFDIEQDFKQEKTEKDKTMENQQLSGSLKNEQTTADNGGFSYPQMAFEDKKSVLQAVKKEIQAVVDKMNTDLYDDYYKPQERQGDFIYDTSKSPYPIVIDGEVNLHYPLLLDENGNAQYEIIKPKPLTINRLFRYQVEVSTHRGDKTVWRGMRFNNADEFEYAVSQIQKQHDNYNAGRMFSKPDDPKNQKNPYWAIINDNQPYWQEIQAAFDKYVPVLQYITTAATGFIKDEQKQAEFDALSDEHKALVRQFSGNLEQENQTMQQTQATQQTAAQGGFSLPKNPENTVNYDLRGLPEFSGSVSAYFNNSKRQELVLAFLKTAERSKDLRSQVFLGIPYEEQKQFDRIAAFSPLELSAILDCKPKFANNLREYIAVVEDFERNHQQKLEDFKKALHALKISPKYQAASIRNRIFDENDLRAEYIDGGKAFAFTKTGEITNGDRLKQVIANAIETIAPAVKYSMSQEEFWQERDDKAFIKQSQIRDLLRSQMSFPAEMVEVKTRHQIWYEDRDMHDTISKSTAGFFTPKNGKTVVIADAFIENPELAVFTAYHELGHRGIELQGRELWDDWLQQARQNPTVRAIADHAQVHYASKGNILSDIAATEEALVEVFAAYKTQKWDYLAERHNVAISQEFRQPQGTAEKLWHAAKNKIGQIFGRQPETLPDSAVFAMLGKLEQSLYQFPEWKQKLEKTVRVGQHNPFVVAKQPIISGSLRVNPTALTNRYRSGGLRFDLNTQDNSEFAKAVDDIAANGKPKGTFFNLGTTPEVWQLIGIQDMPVDIHSDVMIKSVSEYLNLPPQYYRDGTEKGRHNLSPETLKQIPAQLNNPVAIFKSADTSTNPNGYVVLTELIEHDFNTGKEKPVIAALDIRKVGQQKIEVVNITSIYGRWDWQIEKAVEHLDKQGNKVSDLLYWHTTKGHQLANSFGLRLPTWLNSLDDLSNRNIKTEQDLLQYQKDKEMEKNQQQGTTTPEISENTVKFDAFSQSEKENTMNETEKQALAQAFKNLELPDRKYVVKGSLVEFQDRPESEIIAALGWDEFATAVKDYVNSQSDENAEKLSNAYLVYPFYNELANKGIRDDSSLRNRYAKVIESEFSSFHEKRTAALFILQSMWRGRGNSTDITRSYNIDAMTAYIARGRELRSGWRLENRVNEDFLTKNSIFTHKNLREMGLDNNSNLAPYAPELLQEMVKIEEQYKCFNNWKPDSQTWKHFPEQFEIVDFKQIPAAVQKDLILMVSDRYLSKRGMFGVYDNPAISMQHGLAVRSEVQHNLEMLIGQQEKELQRYQNMGLGVPVPQEDAIVQQINAYKETLEQVKNAPAVAFVPEKLFVVGETKPDWRTGEVQRYKTTEINTKTGEIAFVNDPNNLNPNPFGDMTEQARQYLSANNNFALAALGVAPKEMLENVKFDDFGTTETEPRLGDEIITLSNVRLPELILNAHLIGDNGHPLERNLPQFNFETPELKKEQDYISKVAKLLSDNELQKVQTLSNQLSSLRDLRQSYLDNNQGELVNDMNKHITLLERQIGNEVLGAYHNPQRLQEHIIDMEFRLTEIKNEQRANWDMRYYQSAAYLEQQYKQINQNLDLRRQALQTLVNAYPHLKDIQENIAASISLDGNALKWKKEIVKDEYGFNQNQYKSNLGDFVITELREVGAFETKHNGKGFSFKTLKAAKEQVEYWYKEQQLRAELPKTPQVKFDMFEQGVSMPTNNVETQPETVYEFNNGCFVIISNNFADNIDKNGNGDFDNEAQLLHKDYPESLATYYYSVEGVDDNSSAIHLFDNLGRKDYDNFRHYEVDLSNPNWQQDLAKEMVSFVVSKEIINGLDKQQPAEIVKISNGADFWREMSVQMETQRIEQNRIEKREQVFNMITASGVMNTAWNGDETHGTESVLDTPFINKSLYYQDGELVYKDANYEHFETPDIFKISKQDFERHSPQAIALAVMKGVEEYKKMYRPEKAPEQSPTKRNDLQHTVNVGLQQYDNMFSPEIQKTHRLDILASQEKHRSHSVSGSLNEVKQDAFGLPESEKPSLETMGEIQRQGAEKFISEKIDNGTYHNTPLQIVKAEMRYAFCNQLEAVLDMQLTDYKDMYAGWDIEDYTKENEEETYRMFMPKIGNALENIIGEYERVKEKVANFFDVEKSQVADFLNYKEPTEKFELAQKLITDAKSLKTEQALQDGKALSAAEKKVADTKWALAKQPNNAERKTAYEQAQAELTALKSEIKERVQAAMDKGEPYIARYSEFPREPFNNAKAPIEFAITPKGELTEVIGTTDTPHNLVPSNAGQGAVLNTEQRSSPQRIAEVLREHYQKKGNVLNQLDAINAVGGDKVFSELEIKQTLNRALKDYHPSSIRGALESPRMKDEWLQVVIDKHPNAEIKQAAQRVLAERQALSSPTLSDNLEPENHTANKGGFSSPKHEEELAAVVDDDGYERD